MIDQPPTELRYSVIRDDPPTVDTRGRIGVEYSGQVQPSLARGNILQIDTTGTAGPVRLYSCTTSTARGYLVQIDNTAALSHHSLAGPVRLCGVGH
eukprot:COSAG01_NODE_11279_length_1966_cov_18.378147_3_plen_96_part_00